MFKKLLSVSLALLLLFSVAQADVVGRTPDGLYIQHHLTDGTDEDIYFVSQEPEIYVEKEDYNGDNLTDLAVITALGASNACYTLFVNTDEGMVPVMLNGNEASLYNFDYDTEHGIIISHQSNGLAGLLCVETIYTWSGTDLVMRRQLISDQITTMHDDEHTFTTTIDLDHIAITVYEYADGADRQLLFSGTAAVAQEEEATALLQQAMDVLYAGFTN